MIVIWVTGAGIVFVGLAIVIAKVIADTLETRAFNRRNADIRGRNRLPYVWEREYWR